MCGPVPYRTVYARSRGPSVEGLRVKRFSLTRVLKRWWIVLITVAVVALAGFGVYRLHGIFGSN
ncbi:hypothetical protein MFM001_00190 [Mycobacterium sp. MFM001]|nr:hypothetical protein MFM001_00190 [Mycobacterium sp. MFM001]